MALGEIARCLYKRGWADHFEYKQALNALGRLSPDEQAKVETIGTLYK